MYALLCFAYDNLTNEGVKMLTKISILLIAVTGFISSCGKTTTNDSQLNSAAYKGVWKTQNSWSEDYEKLYSNWVRGTFNEDFFTTGKYKGIKTDCADAAYTARLIFAYENKLPFAIRDNSDSRRIITNEKTKWAGNSNRTKLISFINWISTNVASSKSISNDTYPIKINRHYVTPGTVFAMRWTNSNSTSIGHVLMIKKVFRTGRVALLSSTVPRKVRSLTTTYSFQLEPSSQAVGIRKWKQPKHYSGYKMDGYSMEQFQDDFAKHTWQSTVKARLRLRKESKKEAIKFEVKTLCNLVHARVPIVLEGVEKKNQLNRCMNRQEYDDYSTPSRDQKIKDAYKAVRDLMSWPKNRRTKKALKACPNIEYTPGQTMSLYAFIKRVKGNKVSYDPNVSLEARWGLTQEESGCPQY